MEQEKPAIEYAITAGPGRLIDYGVTTETMEFTAPMENQLYWFVGAGLRSIIDGRMHIAPTTTSCMTGK